MRFLSLFSGIEAASMAWLPLGWVCVGVAEIEPFPCAVLAQHYPDVPNLGDITKITEDQIKSLGHIDLIVGGFPCQDLSVAGKRKGLKNKDGTSTRSGLFFDAMRIVRYAEPRFLLIENVPGIYSSNSGRDFASVVGEILGVKFGVPLNGWENTGVAASERGLLEWTTLDAQFFGVPQRRRRMFALADFGDWQTREPVLFDKYSMQGHPAPKREKRKYVAGTVGARTDLSSGAQDAMNGHMISSYCMATGQGNAEIGFDVAPTLNCNHEAPISFGIQGNIIGRQDHNGGNGLGFSEEICGTLTKADQHGVAVVMPFDTTQITSPTNHSHPNYGAPCHTLSSGSHAPAIVYGTQDPCVTPTLTSNGDTHSGFRDEHGLIAGNSQVRRLTPVECARLQGFPEIHRFIEVQVCYIDHQKIYANAATKCLKSQKSVSNAVEKSQCQSVQTVDQSFHTDRDLNERHAALNVRLRSGILEAQLLSQKKSSLNVSDAEQVSWFPLLMLQGDFALAVVRMTKCLAQGHLLGAVELHQIESNSIHLQRGGMPFSLSGNEIAECAGNVEIAISMAIQLSMSITSATTHNSPIYDQNLKTWFCCAVRAIAGCIPKEMIPTGSFALSIETQEQYLDIQYRNRPACDGPKYKSLGNSMAVPVMAWIGKRIQMIEELTA